jgi:hypothetical protein
MTSNIPSLHHSHILFKQLFLSVIYFFLTKLVKAQHALSV